MGSASKSELINTLWQRVYSMVQGHAAAKTLGSYMSLPPRFEHDLLNNLSKLKVINSEDALTLVDEIRGQLGIAEATGFIGKKDVDELYVLLDNLKRES